MNADWHVMDHDRFSLYGVVGFKRIADGLPEEGALVMLVDNGTHIWGIGTWKGDHWDAYDLRWERDDFTHYACSGESFLLLAPQGPIDDKDRVWPDGYVPQTSSCIERVPVEGEEERSAPRRVLDTVKAWWK